MTRTGTAIVVAALDAWTTVRASLEGFLAEADESDVVVLVTSSRDGTPDFAEREFPRVRVLRRPHGRLVPELWTEGLQATDSALVAFSTAQMAPGRGWLACLKARLETTGAAGVGGSIAPGVRLSQTERALYLLRYANYLPPVPASARFEPPGDNALYRRDRLEEVEATWRHGFWEVDVHSALRSGGETLACAPEAFVTFLGGTALGAAFCHRLGHARHYGYGRICGRGWGHRLARATCWPAVPPLLLSRILRVLLRRGESFGPWVPAAPALLMLLTTWSIGEAAGACFGPPARHSSFRT
jgi:hypothetical protein